MISMGFSSSQIFLAHLMVAQKHVRGVCKHSLLWEWRLLKADLDPLKLGIFESGNLGTRPCIQKL